MRRIASALLILGLWAATSGLASAATSRWRLDLENGLTWAGYCDVQIPKSTGTMFSLTDDLKAKASYFFRIRLSYQLHPRHSLSVLYAPLSLTASGPTPAGIWFNGDYFAPQTEVEGFYKFNSYRLTYRYELVNKAKWKVGIGFTAKIRDAAVRLNSASLSSEKTNVGFVPLIHFRVEWTPTDKVGILLEGDALAASQGRAEDIALLLLYRIGRGVSLKAGYRLVEGGANVEEVKNFALIHYAAAGLVVDF